MLGRKTYTPDEIKAARTAVDQQISAYRSIAAAAAGHRDATTTLRSFESAYFNIMVLVLDRYFVHRVRLVSGKDFNPLNEVELIADSLIGNDGVFTAGTVIKFVPGASVVPLEVDSRIQLTAEQFRSLADAFFAELERRFGDTAAAE